MPIIYADSAGKIQSVEMPEFGKTELNEIKTRIKERINVELEERQDSKRFGNSISWDRAIRNPIDVQPEV